MRTGALVAAPTLLPPQSAAVDGTREDATGAAATVVVVIVEGAQRLVRRRAAIAPTAAAAAVARRIAVDRAVRGADRRAARDNRKGAAHNAQPNPAAGHDGRHAANARAQTGGTQ